MSVFGFLVSYLFRQMILSQSGEDVTFFINSLGPTFVVIGTALIMFPSYKNERIARGEDISALSGLSLLTRRWKIVLSVAIVAEFVYWYFLGITPF